MKLRFRKSIKLNDNLKANISKNGVSYSMKVGDVTITKKANGKTRTTYTVPKTGVSFFEEK